MNNQTHQAHPSQGQHDIHSHKEPIKGPYHFHRAFAKDLASPVGVVLAFLLLLALAALIPDFNKWNIPPMNPANQEPALSLPPPADAHVFGTGSGEPTRP